MFLCHPVSIRRAWQSGVYCCYCDVSDSLSRDEARCWPRLDVHNPVISLKDPGGDDTFPSTSITGDPACLKHADVHGFNALLRTCDKHRGAQHPYYGCGRSLTHRSRSLHAVGHIGAGGGGSFTVLPPLVHLDRP